MLQRGGVGAGGYCADGTVRYTADAALAALLEQLALEPLVHVEQTHQCTQKPRAYLRAQDLEGRGRVSEIYPVTLRFEHVGASGTANRGTARWWTRRDGLMLCVERSDTTPQEFKGLVDDARYRPLLHRYRTGCVQVYERKLAPAAYDVEPLKAWYDAWEAWGQARGLRTSAMALLKAVRARTLRFGTAPCLDDLLDTAGAPRQPWCQLVDSFDDALTRETLAELLAHARHMQDELPQALQARAQRTENVRAWFERFFAAHGVGDAKAAPQTLRALQPLAWCVSNDTRAQVQLDKLELRGGRAYVSGCLDPDAPEVTEGDRHLDWSFEGPTDRAPDWTALPVQYA